MDRSLSFGLQRLIAGGQTVLYLPVLQGTNVNAARRARLDLLGSSVIHLVSFRGKEVLILMTNYSSASFCKTALSFFDSTSKAGVSASAISLHHNCLGGP